MVYVENPGVRECFRTAEGPCSGQAFDQSARYRCKRGRSLQGFAAISDRLRRVQPVQKYRIEHTNLRSPLPAYGEQSGIFGALGHAVRADLLRICVDGANSAEKLGIRHAVLIDDDKARHPEVTATILGSRGAHTIGIDSFPEDLESFLGVPPMQRRRPDRKPQHVLYHVSSGSVADERVTAFCEKVETLLGRAPDPVGR